MSGLAISSLNALEALPLDLVQNLDLAGQPLYDLNDQPSQEPFYDADYWQSIMEYFWDLSGGYNEED